MFQCVESDRFFCSSMFSRFISIQFDSEHYLQTLPWLMLKQSCQGGSAEDGALWTLRSGIPGFITKAGMPQMEGQFLLKLTPARGGNAS